MGYTAPDETQRDLDTFALATTFCARWAGTIGPQTRALAQAILIEQTHPEQGYRSCLGILRLGKRYGDVRLEAACARALAAGGARIATSIRSYGVDSVGCRARYRRGEVNAQVDIPCSAAAYRDGILRRRLQAARLGTGPQTMTYGAGVL